MLRPTDTATRERKSLVGLWRFRLDDAGEGRSARWFGGPLPDARAMAVPASFNDIAADACRARLLRRRLVPDDGAGAARLGRPAGRAALRVGDAPGDGLGGRHRGRLPRGRVHAVRGRRHRRTSRPGSEARITVAVNNTLSFQTVPPGVVEDTPDGKRQRYWHDFFNYAGIHRPVWLYATAPAHITDITVVTGLDGTDGTVEYRTEAADADGAEVRVVLRDADGAEVATGAGASGTLTRAERAPVGPR